MAFLAGVDNEMLFIITNHNHKMVPLVDPESFIDQNDEGMAGIDIPLQIPPAARVLGGIQSLFLGVKNHIHVQRSPGFPAEDLGGDFCGSHFQSIKTQNPRQGGWPTLVSFLGIEGYTFNDPGVVRSRDLGNCAAGKKDKQHERQKAGGSLKRRPYFYESVQCVRPLISSEGAQFPDHFITIR